MVERAQRIQELETKITATEAALARLKGELAAERERAQHEAVDNLEAHLTHANVSLTDIRQFIDMVLSEIRDIAGRPKP